MALSKALKQKEYVNREHLRKGILYERFQPHTKIKNRYKSNVFFLFLFFKEGNIENITPDVTRFLWYIVL